MCQATAVAPFHFHVILQLLKIESEEVNMDILLLRSVQWQACSL